ASLIDLSYEKLSSNNKMYWTGIIILIPLFGSIAYLLYTRIKFWIQIAEKTH
ncbi:MAG: PLDc_N domain-containing protein, partial [Actinomycetales bacterium]